MVSPQHGECVVEHQGGGGAGAEEEVTALYLLVAGDPGPPHLLPLLALLAAARHAEPHVPALAHEHPAGRGGQLDTRYWLDRGCSPQLSRLAVLHHDALSRLYHYLLTI